MSHRNWLSRYRAGRTDEVWLELRQLGDRVWEPELVDEAQLVCDEMARRARQNIETLVERLRTAGYRFHVNDDDETPRTPHHPPGPRADEHAQWLRERFGAVPMTLLSWVRIVGDVWLVGTHPEWDASAAADPLVIQAEGSHYPNSAISEYFSTSYESWREWSDENPRAGSFVLPLAPDRLHKNNTSGGPPYGMILPDGCADGLFAGDVPMPFVHYLDHAFRHGGFPGPVDSPMAARIRRTLAKDLLPL
jgi:hypothetical protein